MHTPCTCTLNRCSPWGMVHKFAYPANHLLFILHYFCNDLYLIQGFQNTKHHSGWCAGWSDTVYGCSKNRVHAAADQAWAPLFARFKLSCIGILHIRAELAACKLGGPYPRRMQIPYQFWPEITPFDKNDPLPENYAARVFRNITLETKPLRPINTQACSVPRGPGPAETRAT